MPLLAAAAASMLVAGIVVPGLVRDSAPTTTADAGTTPTTVDTERTRTAGSVPGLLDTSPLHDAFDRPQTLPSIDPRWPVEAHPVGRAVSGRLALEHGCLVASLPEGDVPVVWRHGTTAVLGSSGAVEVRDMDGRTLARVGDDIGLTTAPETKSAGVVDTAQCRIPSGTKVVRAAS